MHPHDCLFMPRQKYVNRLGLLAATVVFTAVGIGGDRGQHFIADAAQVAHTNGVIAGVDAVEARLRDAEAAHRGYLLTGNVDLLGPVPGQPRTGGAAAGAAGAAGKRQPGAGGAGA